MSNHLPTTRRQQLPENFDTLKAYLRELAKYPLLSPEEEFSLAKEHFENQNPKAAHRLITSNLRLVVKIAAEFRQAQRDLLDLVQEGNYGLMQAVKRYNPYKGVKLSSYAAWWIRAYILKFIMDTKSQVKIGTTAAQRKLFFRLKKEADKLLAAYDKVDTKLLASSLEVSEKEVLDMQQRLNQPDISIDAQIMTDDGSYNPIVLTDDRISPEDEAEASELKTIFSEHLTEFRKSLSGRDLEIFTLRMMSDQPLSLQELGDRYGITRERARQLESQIFKKLKTFVEKKGVIDISSTT